MCGTVTGRWAFPATTMEAKHLPGMYLARWGSIKCVLGSPVYEIGSPIFARTTIRMGNGKLFTIVANHVSARNKYIQSAQLNGKPLNYAWFRHADIADGGTLVLEMADHPNLKWGSAPQLAPPSMSDENPAASAAE